VSDFGISYGLGMACMDQSCDTLGTKSCLNKISLAGVWTERCIDGEVYMEIRTPAHTWMCWQ